MSLHTTFNIERGLRSYVFLGPEEGVSFTLEETADGAILLRRTGLATEGDVLVKVLSTILEHYAKYGNLPMPHEDPGPRS